MIKFMESFTVNGRSYGIERSDEEFKVWTNGCCIGHHPTSGQARAQIFETAVNSLLFEYKDYRCRAADAKSALDKLGNDLFNLGRFRDPDAE